MFYIYHDISRFEMRTSSTQLMDQEDRGYSQDSRSLCIGYLRALVELEYAGSRWPRNKSRSSTKESSMPSYNTITSLTWFAWPDPWLLGLSSCKHCNQVASVVFCCTLWPLEHSLHTTIDSAAKCTPRFRIAEDAALSSVVCTLAR
jgi:hypothetical protein